MQAKSTTQQGAVFIYENSGREATWLFQTVDKVCSLIIFASCILHSCKHRRFRLCGGDQRAFRSPFGNLRSFAANGPSTRNGFLVVGKGKAAYLLLFLQRVSPLRRRPKSFPIALWKPSVLCCEWFFHKKRISCGWQGKDCLSLSVLQRVSPLRRRPGRFSHHHLPQSRKRLIYGKNFVREC